jgi:predicted  nucleic acid-binding Zn-ribbon protein
MAKQTTIQPLTELEELLKEKKFIERIIGHYRTEYKKVRMMVRDKKRELRALNIKIAQLTRPAQTEEQK